MSSKPAFPVTKASSAASGGVNVEHLDQRLDSQTQVALAKAWSGISPISLALAYTDWALHLMASPGSQSRLARQAARHGLDWVSDAASAAAAQAPELVQRLTQPLTDKAAVPVQDAAPSALTPLAQALNEDARYDDAIWHHWPWRPLATANKAWESWWKDASNLRGMEDHSREQMRFYGRQMLDMWSPSNWLLTNPEAWRAAWESGGQSLVKGLGNAVDELRLRHGQKPLLSRSEDPSPGHGMAMTPGKVVMRNDLVELIQYQPTTDRVHETPVLIIPSCIMKYYILDLTPANSMVGWLVDQGHTVYIVSWHNPDASDALLSMDDYVRDGVLASLDHVRHATGVAPHLVGYCLGGTFAAIAAAAVGQDRPAPMASLTLMAAETDFSEPGEMGVLLDEAQVTMLEDMMAEQGFLTGKQMAGSFQFLHARDLVWSSRTKRWLLGEDEVSNDLMVWNADVTRLPAVMHSEYLRRCFLRNELAEGTFPFEGRPVSLHDIRVPVFGIGTVKDHVAPWRSVYKMHRLVAGPVTFALTNGGHNAGIVSEPGHKGRRYQLLTTTHDDSVPTPDEWLARAPAHEGSWWQAWDEWLVAQGGRRQVPARVPPEVPGLGDAPGQNVLVRYGD